jgi:hypothetical protein
MSAARPDADRLALAMALARCPGVARLVRKHRLRRLVMRALLGEVEAGPVLVALSALADRPGRVRGSRP